MKQKIQAMRRTKFNRRLILLLTIICFSFSAFGQTRSKTLEHTFENIKGSKLVINNKYGDINITDWNENKVSIDIKIEVTASSEEKSEKLLKYINVEFSTEDNLLKAITKIEDKFSSSKSGWIHFDDDKNFSINYTIKMPKDLDIELVNKYGDLTATELNGHSDINIRYGTIRANKIMRGNTKPYSSITLAYSSRQAYIEECDWLKLKISYSKIEFSKAKALLIKSSYSEIEIEEASSIVCDSKYDKYRLGKINNVSISCAYSGFRAKEVKKSFEFNGKYSNCRVQYIPVNFTDINIKTAYGSVKLGIDENASYQVKGEAKYGKIHTPSRGRLNRISESSKMSISGTIGEDSNPNSKIKVYTRYASVDLVY